MVQSETNYVTKMLQRKYKTKKCSLCIKMNRERKRAGNHGRPHIGANAVS